MWERPGKKLKHSTMCGGYVVMLFVLGVPWSVRCHPEPIIDGPAIAPPSC